MILILKLHISIDKLGIFKDLSLILQYFKLIKFRVNRSSELALGTSIKLT